MKLPCSHSGEPNASNGASSTSPSGRPSAGRLATGSSRGERLRGRAQRVGAQRRLGGAVAGGHQRARRLRRRAPRTTARRSTAGCEWRSAASAGRARRAAPRTQRAALARGAAQHGVDEPRPAAARSALASSTDSPTAAWAATPSRNASWKAPSRSAASTGGLEPLDRPPGQLGDQVVERRARAGRRRRRAAWRARGRARRGPARRASPCSARSAQASCSNTRRSTAKAHARAGGPRRGGRSRACTGCAADAWVAVRTGPARRRVRRGATVWQPRWTRSCKASWAGLFPVSCAVPEVPEFRPRRTFVQMLTISLKGLIICGESAESSRARGL